jgi:hypothetical protein
VVQGYSLDVNPHPVAVGINLFAHSSCFQGVMAVIFLNNELAYAQQQLLGILIVDELLKKIEEEQVERIMLNADSPALLRLN